MSKYFKVSGYWKDDKTEFNDLIVKEFDDAEENESDDDLIFFYGLGEQELKDSSDDDALEFVITSFEEIDWNKY